MNKKFRLIFYILLSLGAIAIIATVSINIFLKNKLESFIQERLPENMVRAYDDISVQTFSGSIILSNASLIIKNKEDEIEHTFINVEKLKISNISYWDYLFNDEIHVETISLENPIMAYYKDRMKPSGDTIKNGIFRIYKPISVDKIKIQNTKFAIYENQTDSTKLYTKGLSIEVAGIKVDNNTIFRKIPFEYENFEAKTDSLFVKVSNYENLTAGDFLIKNQNAVFTDLKLKTKYSKRELSRIINKERDHYNLTLKTLKIDDFDFGFQQGTFFAKTKHVLLNQPSLEIYRDKLVADDPKVKPLYNKMLRELPFELTVDSLNIEGAKIIYEERVKPENMGGSINFENLDAAISNVSNTYKNPTRTNIKVKANFMDKTPLTANWSFDVQNKNDHFTFNAEVGALVAEKMNSFTEPNLKVRLEGRTNKTYFTIDGNNETSTTNMKISYSDFKVSVLQKDGGGKNRLLSAIANIFISKNSEKKDEYYREGSADATRNKTQSVFNFIWISVKNSLLKTMTGSGKKE